MPSTPKSVREYLASLPAERRATVSAVRAAVLAGLDEDYEEGLQYGMIGYYVPHRIFPAGYHSDPDQPLPFAALASQKNHVSLYLMGLYCGGTERAGDDTPDAKRFREAWLRTGKRLDMGRACVRFKRLDDVPLQVITDAIRRIPARVYVKRYQRALARPSSSRRRTGSRRTAS